MRYKDTGEVHKDFHLGTNTTISYIIEKYGDTFLAELFRRTAQKVYRDIYENLKEGKSGALLEHWEYYYKREQGKYSVSRNENEIVFHVLECPAAAHLEARTGNIPESFLLQTILLNRAWSEGTPFEIETERIGPKEYKMIIRGGLHAAE